jgi:hypothetical protein
LAGMVLSGTRLDTAVLNEMVDSRGGSVGIAPQDDNNTAVISNRLIRLIIFIPVSLYR